MKVEIPKLKCKRCPHEWIPRTDDVRTCPKCRSPYWDKPRKGEQPQAETKQDPPKIFQAGPGPIYRPETETKEPTVIQPQDMPAKSKPREATESEKKAFLCAYSHKFDCPAYDTKKPAYEWCGDCFDAAFWSKKDTLLMTMEDEEEQHTEQAYTDGSQLEQAALACDKKTYDPAAKVWNCHYRNIGNYPYPYCRLCIELVAIWGSSAVGYKERNK